MLRDYKNGYFEDVRMSSGKEIEHTPAYGLQTLFLARNDLTLAQIEEQAVMVQAEAIYYGANRTYMHNHGMQLSQIIQLCDKGYYVTVDYPYELHDEVKEKFNIVWKHEKFIPFCSIIFPHTEDDTQLCIKVDDTDFNKTNPGVWTMTMNDFKSKSGHTKWEEYKKDEPITEDKWIIKVPKQ